MLFIIFQNPSGSIPCYPTSPLRFYPGEKIALVGPNGCGNTTLLRTAADSLPVLSGRCRLGANVIPDYITQEQEEQDSEFNALTTFQRSASLNETDSRAFLHKCLFSSDEDFTPVGSLSYGQRARLALACLVARGCNFLLLGEPLNHLDLPLLAQFEHALTDFEGTILTVLHDRSLFSAMRPACGRSRMDI